MSEKPDGMTIAAIVLIGLGAVIYGSLALMAVLVGFALTFPFGLLGVLIFGLPAIGVGLLLLKVVMDRLNDPEDRHYSRDIHQ